MRTKSDGDLASREIPEVPFAQKTTGKRYLGLQWLRILACLMVLWFHATLYIRTAHLPVYYRGAAGVDIFFVLSGFVIVIASGKLQGTATGWSTFARHRVLRIVPMYWFVTSVALLLLVAESHAHGRVLPSFLWVLCSYLFIPYHSAALEPGPVLGVGWTLEFEMAFYAICTFILLAFRKLLPYTYVPLVLLATASLWRDAFSAEAARFLDPIVLEFALGMWIADRCLRGKYLQVGFAWVLWSVSLALLIYWPLPLAGSHMANTGVLAASLIYATASLEDYFVHTPRLVLLLADATYLLYLIHVPIVLEFSKSAERYHFRYVGVTVALAIATSVAVALALRVALEAPLLRWLQPSRAKAERRCGKQVQGA